MLGLTKIKKPVRKKTKERVLPLTVIVSICFLSLVVLRPLMINIFDLRSKTKTQSNKLSDLTKKIDQLESLNKAMLDIKVNQIERVLPSEKPVMVFLDTMIILADKNGIEIGAIELSPGEIYNQESQETKTEAKTLQDMKIAFSLTGGIDTISAFLDDLEETAPLMRVESIAFSLLSSNYNEGETSSQLDSPEATLEMKIYYQPLPKSLGSVEAPLPEITSQEKLTMEEVVRYNYYEGEVIYVPVGKENPFVL